MATSYRARVTSKGQITLPKAVRDALGVETGDEVTFEVDIHGVSVRPVRPPSKFRALQGKWRTGSGWTREQTDAWLREIRGDRETS